MPVIPPEYVGTNAFPDRPAQSDINPESYGRDAATLSSLGGEIGDVGSRLLQARKHAMENDFANNAETADSTWLPKTVEGLRRNFAKKDAQGNPVINPDGSMAYDPTGFADALKQQMDQRVNDNVNSMPTGDAQRLYREKTQNMFNMAFRGAYEWENQTRISSLQNNMESRADEHNLGILGSQAPYESTILELDRLEKEANDASGQDGLLHPENADKFYKSKAKTAIDTMFAAYSKDPGLAKEGLQKISEIAAGDGPTEKRMASLTDIRDLERYQTKLTEVVKKGYQEDERNFKAKYDGIMAAFNSNDPKVAAMVNDQDARALALQAVALAPAKGPTWAQEHIMGLVVGSAYKQNAALISSLPESDKDVFKSHMAQDYQAGLRGLGISPEDAHGFGLDKLEVQNKKYEALWKQATAARKADLGKYIEDNHRNLPGSISNGIPNATRLSARQDVADQLHHSDGNLLQNSERSAMIAELKEKAGSDPGAAALRIQELQATAGEHSHKIMSEMVGKGLPRYFQAAMDASSPDVAKEIIDISGTDALTGKSRGAELEAKAKADGYYKEINKSVDAVWEAPSKTMTAVGTSAYNKSVGDEMRTIVERKAILYHQQGMTSDQAAKEAVDDLYYKDYHVLGTAYMPRQIGGEPTRPDVVSGAMQAVYQADPSGFMLPFNTGGLNADERLARLTQAKTDGHWITDNSKDTPNNPNPHPGSRAIFMVPQVTGGHRVWAPLMHTDGTKVYIDYAKMSHNPTPDALNNARRFWEPKIGPDGMPQRRNADPQTFAPDIAPPVETTEHDMKEENISPDQKLKTGVAPKDTGIDNGKGRNLASVSDAGLNSPESYKDEPDTDPTSEGKDGDLPSQMVGDPRMIDMQKAVGPVAHAEKEKIAARIVAKGKDIEHMIRGPGGMEYGNSTSVTSIADGVVKTTNSSTPLSSGEYSKFGPLIISSAKEHKVDPQIMADMIRVESNFNPNALGPKTSSGSQAVGLGQFFPAAAKETNLIVGLVHGKWVDERKDANKMIPAIAQFLSNRLNEFGGSYEKALAAYKAGAGTVRASIRDHGENGWFEHLSDYKLGKGGKKDMAANDYVNKVLGR